MGRQHSFFGSAIYYTFGVILAQGMQFLLMNVIFGRLFTEIADYNLMSLYYTFFSVFGTLVGLEAASSLNNARIKFGEDKLNHYASSMIGVGLITLGIYAAGMAAGQAVLTPVLGFSGPVLLSCAIQGFFMFVITLLAQKCRVTNKPLQFVFWTSLATLLRLGLSTIFVINMTENQYMGDVYGSLLSYGAVGVAALAVLLRDGKSIGNRAYWKYCLALTIPIVFHTLANQVLGYADRVMLRNMLNDYEAGIYSYVYNIGAISNAVWLAFNNAWTVWYYDRVKEGNNAAILDLYKKYAGFVTLLTFALIFISPDLVTFFGGEKWAAGVPLIPIIMLGCFFMFLYTFPVNYETYRHKTIFIALGTVTAAAVNIALNLYFIPRWGIMGAAVATLLSYIVLFVFHFAISRFIVKGFQIRFMQLLLPALATVGAVALTYALMDASPPRWVAAGAALVASFFVFKKSRHIMM